MNGEEASLPAAESRRELPAAESGVRPVLTETDLEVLRRYGSEHDVEAGEVLFADGDETYDLIVVLDGEVEIVEGYGQPSEVAIVEYGPLEFLGEIGMLTGQRAYLSAVARTPGRVLRVPVDQPRIERAVREILLAIGEDPERDGLANTPARVARMYAEQFAGLRQRPEDVLNTVFDEEHDEIVLKFLANDSNH